MKLLLLPFIATIIIGGIPTIIRGGAKDAEKIFTSIYKTNGFGEATTVSGPGSTLQQTKIVREKLQTLLSTYKIKTIVDAPCGDFNWMKVLDLAQCHYYGFDIVKDIIEANKIKYQAFNINFACANLIVDQLPQADLIICRDCFVHFPIEDIIKALRNFKKSKAIFLIATTFTRTYNVNKNIPMGYWRPINLQLPPFNLPEPIEIINEKCTEAYGAYVDKSIALWKLEDINV